ncbi:MAG TPA: YCF48-related protein [Ktedonobacterales bacterium]|nr:YCF48-related protein [Ktedonobacterales bacterium]
MNTKQPQDMDLEARLRARYQEPRLAPPDRETLWARLSPHLDVRALTSPHAEDEQGLHHLLNPVERAAPKARLPAPFEPPASRRFFAGLPALAAMLVVAVLVVALFGFFTRTSHGTSSLAGVPDRSQMTLNSLSMVSPDEGWAVGNTWSMVNTGSTTVRLDAGDPVILHYLNGRWTAQPLPDYKRALGCGGSAGACPPFVLNGISMVSAQEGWAVGNSLLGPNADGITFGLLLHYTGGKWVQVAVRAAQLSGIYMRSATDGWIIGQWIGSGNPLGQSIALHYAGHAWTPVNDPAFAHIVPLSLTGAADGQVWISGVDYSVPVGDGEDGNEPAVLLQHYDGTRWSKVDPHIANGRLYGITLVGPDEGWAVGMQPNSDQHRATEVDGVILHNQHGVWQEQTHFKAPFGQTDFTLTSVAMASPAEGWAVGDGGVILHYQSGTWERAPSPTSENLSSITMVSASEGWAIGDHGTILHYHYGAWSLYRGS